MADGDRLRQMFPNSPGIPNHFRFRISPDVELAIGVTVMDEEDREIGQQTELLMHHRPGADEMDAYERVLGDAMAGDATLFSRQDGVEAAWAIVDPILRTQTPVHEYEPGCWGPPDAARLTADVGGWHAPGP